MDYFELNPVDYMEKIGRECKFRLEKSDSSYWVLGGTLLKKYYTIFDLDHGEIGFARSNFEANVPYMKQVMYFASRFAVAIGISYIMFELVIGFFRSYYPESKLLKRLNRCSKRMNKTIEENSFGSSYVSEDSADESSS